MRIRTDFPRRVRVEQAWIPMADGTRLHARIWLPEDAETDPVPALLEYLPYRKGDWTAPRDAQRHPWYAGHGYASVRVDLRGSGNSEGVMLDEYTETELADGCAVIDWLAAQPWCTGAVGMFGISWGGFNALQVAARRPEPLRAIVTVCSTDDRYDNDVHYTGGAVLGVDMLAWSGTMLAFTARPPDPAVVGSAWRDQWSRRLDGLEPFATTWLSHQERDDYWRHGSVSEDYGAIRAAVLAVGGFADPYRDTVLRLVEHLPAPVRGILGPWAHQYPDIEKPPGPAIGFLQETLRWWDHWLKGDDNGAMDTPLLRAYLQDAVPPGSADPIRPGEWVGLEQWPPAQPDGERVLELDKLTPSLAQGVSGETIVRTPQHSGLQAGRFFPFGNRADLPPDQRSEDALAACFDTPTLTQDLPLLGKAVARLRLSSDTARAHVVVRLCDVAPDGSSTLVARGVLNLLKRRGPDRADELEPGRWEDCRVDLVATSHVLPAGHRLRVAVSNAYWPWVWPHPEAGALHLDPARCRVELPVCPRDVRETGGPGADSGRVVRFDEPEQAEPLPMEVLGEPGGPERQVTQIVDTGEWVLEVDPRYSTPRRFPDGLEYAEHATETYRIAGDPLSASGTSRWRITMGRGGWRVGIEAETRITADADTFHVESRLVAKDDQDVVADRSWTHAVPRTSA